MSVIGTPFVKSAGLSGSSQREGLREYKVVYVVKTTAGDGAFIAGNAVGLPSRGATYAVPHSATELDTGATLSDIDPQPVGNTKGGHTIWDVTCTYSSKGPGAGGDPSHEQDNPLLRPVRKNWGSANYIFYPFQDLDGKPFINTAGKPYDASAPVEETILVLTATKAQAAFDPGNVGLGTYGFDILAAINFQNTVNKAVFAEQSAGKVLCKSIRATEEYQSGIAYLDVTYVFHFREPIVGQTDKQTWQLQLMDRGPYYIDGGLPDGTKKFHKIEGTATTVDVKLNGTTGDKIADNAAPQYNSFRTRKESNFNQLGLGF